MGAVKTNRQNSLYHTEAMLQKKLKAFYRVRKKIDFEMISEGYRDEIEEKNNYRRMHGQKPRRTVMS